MSLTTTSGRNSSISGTSASAASAAEAPSAEPGAGGGKVLYSSRRREPQPRRLDRLPPLLPGLDQHLVPAPPQRPRQRDRRERVPGVAERRDQEPQPRRLHCNPRCAPPRRTTPPAPAARYPFADATPRPKPRRAPALRRRGPAAPHQGGDAARASTPTGSSSAPTSTRDGGVCPMLAAHRNGGRTELRQLRPRLGPLHRRQAPPPGDPPRGAHAPLLARDEPLGRRSGYARARSPRRPPRSAPSGPRSPSARPSRLTPPSPLTAPDLDRRPNSRASPARHRRARTGRMSSATACAGPGCGRRDASTSTATCSPRRRSSSPSNAPPSSAAQLLVRAE